LSRTMGLGFGGLDERIDRLDTTVGALGIERIEEVWPVILERLGIALTRLQAATSAPDLHGGTRDVPPPRRLVHAAPWMQKAPWPSLPHRQGFGRVSCAHRKISRKRRGEKIQPQINANERKSIQDKVDEDEPTFSAHSRSFAAKKKNKRVANGLTDKLRIITRRVVAPSRKIRKPYGFSRLCYFQASPRRFIKSRTLFLLVVFF